jgi:GMP synthase (glutamine-hydrolysing)
MALNLLIIDAYSAKGRDSVIASGATHAGQLFDRTIRLHRPDVSTNVVDFNTAGPDLTDTLEHYDGVVWTGSNMTIHRRNPLIDAQIAFSQAAFDRGVPQFGVCWAIQLAAVAAGGEAEANAKGREIGWARDIQVNEAGQAHPMYQGKQPHFDALCWHSDTVTRLPEGAVLLASNAMSDVQAAIVKRGKSEFWAVQYHLEFDGHEAASLLQAYAPGLIEAGQYADETEAQAFIKEMRVLKQMEDAPSEAPAALQPIVDWKIRTAELGNWLTWVEQGCPADIA